MVRRGLAMLLLGMGAAWGADPTPTDREIGIQPSVDFSHLDVVLVVLSKPAPVPVGSP